MKKTIFWMLALLFTVTSVSAVYALEEGNKRKGKYIYRKVYKACYERGAVDSKTPPISPADKTMGEWVSTFESRNFDQFGCEQEWAELNEEEITDIYTYLHAHGSDSPTPAKCK